VCYPCCPCSTTGVGSNENRSTCPRQRFSVQSVRLAQIELALRPWLDYVDADHIADAKSLEREEPGIVFDARERVVSICWTGDVGRSFHNKLTEACNSLGPLTEYASEVEVTYYPDSGEDEFHQFFIGPSPKPSRVPPPVRGGRPEPHACHAISASRKSNRSPNWSRACSMPTSRRSRPAAKVPPPPAPRSFRCIRATATCTEPGAGVISRSFSVRPAAAPACAAQGRWQ